VPVLQSWLQLAKLPAFNLARTYFSPAIYTSDPGFPTISTCRKPVIIFPSTTSQIPLFFHFISEHLSYLLHLKLFVYLILNRLSYYLQSKILL